eukprot:CAMPEP_0181062420 /NCGR_PEP_ID=MMETSP1070-20121207/23071_1 /TAXON_ID=265543 /ORGANISM="Minutocellus polymorphus, Strain NH13" /LENGTH=637 /DNA_ID=CAMNT_0023142493 /DNA_START=93 /DNA_END=2003 /DNA_ORIENTATION=-
MPFLPSSVEAIVLKLVQGEEGVAWANRRNGWNPETNQPVCAWEGITCDEDGSIIALDVAGSDLRAKIPPEYGQLKSLRSLNLAECDLYGPIPPEVVSLPNLESFDVSANAVDGTIPSSFAPSGSMRNIVLRDNRLKGPLPDPLPTELAVLDVSKNHITGTIPWSYEQLHSIAFFDVSHNELVGSLPYHIGDLQNLQGFFVNNNRLMGTIPYSFSRDDSNLVQLFLEYNDLSGTIPAGLADIPPLKDLFVDGNKFTGTVPRSLCKLTLNEDFFKDKFNVSGRDGCTSISCPVNTVSEEGVYPCHQCPRQGFSPYLGHNKKCYYLDERMILDVFWKRTDGPNWIGGDGWNVLNAEKCMFQGITCNNAGKVINIALPNMNLRGTIPEELGYLSQLQHLNLSNNELTGFLPSDLRFAPLESLDLSGNRIEGFVPPMLCLTGDINGNGENGDFACDVISCSAGTWSPIGRATHKTSRFIEEEDRYECQPCPGSAQYLGSKFCPVVNVVVGSFTQSSANTGGIVAGLIFAALLLCCTSGIVGARISRFLSQKAGANCKAAQSRSGAAQGSSSGSGVGSSNSGKSGDQDEAEELWFLNIPKDGIDDDVETKLKSKSKSKSKKKKKKKSNDEGGEEELYFVDVPS